MPRLFGGRAGILGDDMKETIGIDPGQSGAIALYREGLVVGVEDMPTMARLHGKGQQVDPYALAGIIRTFVEKSGEDISAVIEAVAAMPGQGVSSMFRFGESVGVVVGVLGAMQVPMAWCTPQRWKKIAGLLGKDKDAARSLAIQLHPEVASMLTRKKDCGRADSILIAKFGGANG